MCVQLRNSRAPQTVSDFHNFHFSMLRNWPGDSDLVLVRHSNQLHQSMIRQGGDPYRVEGVPKSRNVWKDWPELGVELSCSTGGSALTWAAPWEAYTCFLRVWCRRGGKNGGWRLDCLRMSWWGMRGERWLDLTPEKCLEELRWVSCGWPLEVAV